MAVWLVRAGAHGEYEQKFIREKRIYVTWDRLDVDIAKLGQRSDLAAAMTQRYLDSKPKAIVIHVGQVWPFAHEMKKGDLVVIPLKQQPAIQIGEITGDYQFDGAGPDPFFHWRSVKWIGEAIPRANFAQDLLHSFGALLTICRIQRNNAEARIAGMRANGWKPETVGSITTNHESPVPSDDTSQDVDLEELGRDQIAKLIAAKFAGHMLTTLVEAILKVQGYTTYRSPEGPDGGVDIVAGAGPLGFGSPRLCVEVKSGSTLIDRPTVDKLLGAMTKFGAQEGLFVSWSGFKLNVQKDLAPSFFRVRLWTQKELLEQLFEHYDALDEDIKAELPLKRIWTVAVQSDD